MEVLGRQRPFVVARDRLKQIDEILVDSGDRTEVFEGRFLLVFERAEPSVYARINDGRNGMVDVKVSVDRFSALPALQRRRVAPPNEDELGKNLAGFGVPPMFFTVLVENGVQLVPRMRCQCGVDDSDVYFKHEKVPGTCMGATFTIAPL